MKRKLIRSPWQLPSSVGSESSTESKQLPPTINDDEVSLPPSISDEESPHSELPLSIRTENAEYGNEDVPIEDDRADNSIGSDSDCRCSEDMKHLKELMMRA